MGKFDSTKTRVTPVFKSLENMGSPWLGRLLSLPTLGHRDRLSWEGCSMQAEEIEYGTNEKPLPAPFKLLDWLTGNVQDVTGKGLDGLSINTRGKRSRLLARDPVVIAEARTLLASDRSDHQWFVLEGPSCPDVFISTPDLIVVIEGKRTEPVPTTGTTWMSPRHQMLRHMDCALEAAHDRTVLGFFIVESGTDGKVPDVWKRAAADTISPEVLDGSLPHRTAAERELIAKGFLGVTTWQAVCREFAIDPLTLPDTV
jgi:hypothetical protein